MRKLELNIGFSDASRIDGVAHAVMQLRYLGLVRDWELILAEYPTEVEVVRETAMVVELDCHKPPDFVELILTQLAVDLKQDAIACYYPDEDRGELIGPKAEEWGRFNLEFFTRPKDIKRGI